MTDRFRTRLSLLAAALLLLVSPAVGQRELKPGWNLFSPQQDIELGREAVKEIEKEVQVVDDKRLTNYVAGIGQRLAKVAPGYEYPYSFKVVADDGINAFALPGGPIYVNTGLITAAENEAQLAGVLAHEVSHVVLRHGTSQATKAKAIQLPLVLAGGLLKGGGMLESLAQIGLGVGLNSVFLKYSRDAERQADRQGARLLGQTGYDPLEMAEFFENLAGSGGSRPPAFLSSHPAPENRVGIVQEEISHMPRRNYTKGSREFYEMKKRAERIKVPEKKQPGEAGQAQAGHGGPPGKSGFEAYRGAGYGFSYPADWKVYPTNNGEAVTIAPPDGIIRRRNGQTALSKAILAGFFDPRDRELDSGTNELIADLQSSNPDLRSVRGQRKDMSVGNQRGRGVLLEGSSPLPNERELVWLVTTERPRGFFYLLMVSPDGSYNELRGQYERVVDSVRFP